MKSRRLSKHSPAVWIQPWIAVCVVLTCCAPSLSQTLTEALLQEELTSLVSDAREKGSVVRGAVLFAEERLACAGCHAQGATDSVGPDLTALPDDVTASQLAEAILAPSKSIRRGYEQVRLVLHDGKTIHGRVTRKTATEWTLRSADDPTRSIVIAVQEVDEASQLKTSAMPDKLADALTNRSQFLDLLHYVIHLREQDASSNDVEASPPQAIAERVRGQVLIENHHCAACHAQLKRELGFSTPTAPSLDWTSGRVDPSYLQSFIAEPRRVDAETTMPHLFDGYTPDERTQIADDLTHFIVSLSDRVFEHSSADVEASAEAGRGLFQTVGCQACHQAGSLAYIAGKYNPRSLTEFLEHPRAARPHGRMPEMQLNHFEAEHLAAYLLEDDIDQDYPTRQVHAQFDLDQQSAARGRQHFVERGCIACHAVEGIATPPDASQVPIQNVGSNRSCVSGTGKGPRYRFNDRERDAIAAALRGRDDQFSLDEKLQITLARFNCGTCHERNNWGGVTVETDALFQTTNPNLGPQGRLPPTLTGVGAKLNPKWLRQVLVASRSIRPYMKTRMPQFGAANVGHLAGWFSEADRAAIPHVESPPIVDEKSTREAGFQLVSRDGMNCIACHTYRLKPAETMSAVDLTEMSERLKKDWFVHYMRNPQRLSPRTVMPSFWPGGQSLRPEVLEGDSSRQIEALWLYLEEGRQARTPRGLVREPMQLLANEEAVMLRRSWPDVGKRGIGVGYPSQVNQVFDAEQLRLAIVWQGRFADASGVWRSQGHGVARPLAREQYRFAKGPDLDDARQPWPVDVGRPPAHQFLGYDLDAQQRPSFRYRFESIDVTDTMIDQRDPDANRFTFARTVNLVSQSARPGLRFRVASGATITRRDAHTYQIGRRLEVNVPDHPLIEVANEEHTELFIPFDAPAGPLSLRIIYRFTSASTE